MIAMLFWWEVCGLSEINIFVTNAFTGNDLGLPSDSVCVFGNVEPCL